jgi:hypothetical protein
VSALVIVAAVLAVLPVLNLWGVIHWTWTAALAPAWGGFLIVGWSYVAGWLLNDIGFIVLLPLIATVIACAVVIFEELPEPEPEPTPVRAFGTGGTGDRVLHLIDGGSA